MKSFPAKVFYSYSHKDEDLRKELEVHLAPLERQGLIINWHDGQILPGENLNEKIDKKLFSSDVVLLLISPDFLASDYCYNIEMKKALELHEKKHLIVIPIILRRCHWKNSPFKHLLGLPTDMIPVRSRQWFDQDEAFHIITEGINEMVHSFFQETPFPDNTSRSSINNFNDNSSNSDDNDYSKRVDHFDYSELRQAVLVLRSVNHKLRQTIVDLIDSENQELTVTDIYVKLRLEQTVASQHLAILRRAGVIITNRRGKYIYYSLNKERIKQIGEGVKLLS